jgi:hypothetical protein
MNVSHEMPRARTSQAFDVIGIYVYGARDHNNTRNIVMLDADICSFTTLFAGLYGWKNLSCNLTIA